jgi:hypothetical protein
MLVLPISAGQKAFNGDAVTFSVSLVESKGWLKDPQNALAQWAPPSKCDMIQVLSRLSSLRILGDWTNWYESVALDDVSFANVKGKSSVLLIILCIFLNELF